MYKTKVPTSQRTVYVRYEGRPFNAVEGENRVYCENPIKHKRLGQRPFHNVRAGGTYTIGDSENSLDFGSDGARGGGSDR